jgi:hypothetical protein
MMTTIPGISARFFGKFVFYNIVLMAVTCQFLPRLFQGIIMAMLSRNYYIIGN